MDFNTDTVSYTDYPKPGRRTSFGPKSLIYDENGIVHYIRVYDKTGNLQTYQLQQYEAIGHKAIRWIGTAANIILTATAVANIKQKHDNGEITKQEAVESALSMLLIKGSVKLLRKAISGSHTSNKPQRGYNYGYFNIVTGEKLNAGTVRLIV